MASPLIDSFGRRIDYLRIALTERCDLRCAYCHPQPRAEAGEADPLRADDIVAIATAATRLGFRRIRLTGGEPLLRPDLEEIVSRLRPLPGLEDLALTTNAQKLADRAAGLAAAGLMRVNVSLDSLDSKVYAAITGGGDVRAVIRGLDAAIAAGLSPVKANVVLTSAASLERADLPALAALIRRRPIHVRFIEAMPTCSHAAYLPAESVLDRLASMGRLEPVPGPDGGGPARYYQLDGSQGAFGVITPISDPFCARCNRLRVTARGDLISCLFSPSGLSLLPALAEDDPLPPLQALLRKAAVAKPCRYRDIEPAVIDSMNVIGG